MTVASIPMWSALERSMPPALGLLPRKMLPPPTTMAISVPSEACSSASSRATCCTIVGSMPPLTSGSENASPESLIRTRL
jgi:hypothetical protein